MSYYDVASTVWRCLYIVCPLVKEIRILGDALQLRLKGNKQITRGNAVAVVVLRLYGAINQLRSYGADQITYSHCAWAGLDHLCG